MTPEQRSRLIALLPAMKNMARRKAIQNDYYKSFAVVNELEDVLRAGAITTRTPEEWISIAEKAAEGHDNPGTIRMPSMAAVLSGMPPEHKEEA